MFDIDMYIVACSVFMTIHAFVCCSLFLLINDAVLFKTGRFVSLYACFV